MDEQQRTTLYPMDSGVIKSGCWSVEYERFAVHVWTRRYIDNQEDKGDHPSTIDITYITGENGCYSNFFEIIVIALKVPWTEIE